MALAFASPTLFCSFERLLSKLMFCAGVFAISANWFSRAFAFIFASLRLACKSSKLACGEDSKGNPWTSSAIKTATGVSSVCSAFNVDIESEAGEARLAIGETMFGLESGLVSREANESIAATAPVLKDCQIFDKW